MVLACVLFTCFIWYCWLPALFFFCLLFWFSIIVYRYREVMGVKMPGLDGQDPARDTVRNRTLYNFSLTHELHLKICANSSWKVCFGNTENAEGQSITAVFWHNITAAKRRSRVALQFQSKILILFIYLWLIPASEAIKR